MPCNPQVHTVSLAIEVKVHVLVCNPITPIARERRISETKQAIKLKRLMACMKLWWPVQDLNL